jgi:hypothetical protein
MTNGNTGGRRHKPNASRADWPDVMTQASEPEVVSEHSEGEGIRGNGMQTIDSEGDTIRDNSEHGN